LKSDNDYTVEWGVRTVEHLPRWSTLDVSLNYITETLEKEKGWKSEIDFHLDSCYLDTGRDIYFLQEHDYPQRVVMFDQDKNHLKSYKRHKNVFGEIGKIVSEEIERQRAVASQSYKDYWDFD